MAVPGNNWRRTVLGILSAVLLVSGIGLLLAYGVDAGKTSMAASVCMRIGLVLGSIWLAFPLLTKASAITISVFILGGSIIAVRPKTALAIVPILLVMGALQFVGWLMKPAPRKRRSAPDKRNR